MYPELTNLLPPRQARAFRRVYFVRLGVVTLLLLCIAVVAHAVLLLPTYLYAVRETSREQAQLDALSSSLQTSEEKQVNARLGTLRDSITFLSKLSGQPTATAAVRAVLAVPRPGIVLSGFTFTAAQGSAPATMALTGTASTRDTLRAYVQSLSQLPFVTSADLPISAYAKDANISFTITLAGSFKP